MHTARSLLREAVRAIVVESSSTTARKAVADLRPGDMFRTRPDGPVMTYIRGPKPKKAKVLWIIGVDRHHGEGAWVRHPTSWSGMLDPSSQETQEYLRWNFGRVDAVFQGVETAVDNVDVLIDGKKSHHHFSWAVGPRAAEVNAALATTSIPAVPLYATLGVDSVEFVGVDPDRQVGPALAPGLKIKDLILKAIIDAGNEPMDAEEAMRRAHMLGGRPHVPGSGSMYFTLSGRDSLVAAGLLTRHGRGKSARFTVTVPEQVDWRPDTSIPEDHYAL